MTLHAFKTAFFNILDGVVSYKEFEVFKGALSYTVWPHEIALRSDDEWMIINRKLIDLCGDDATIDRNRHGCHIIKTGLKVIVYNDSEKVLNIKTHWPIERKSA